MGKFSGLRGLGGGGVGNGAGAADLALTSRHWALPLQLHYRTIQPPYTRSGDPPTPADVVSRRSFDTRKCAGSEIRRCHRVMKVVRCSATTQPQTP